MIDKTLFDIDLPIRLHRLVEWWSGSSQCTSLFFDDFRFALLSPSSRKYIAEIPWAITILIVFIHTENWLTTTNTESVHFCFHHHQYRNSAHDHKTPRTSWDLNKFRRVPSKHLLVTAYSVPVLPLLEVKTCGQRWVPLLHSSIIRKTVF